jgi:hypothetical protein
LPQAAAAGTTKDDPYHFELFAIGANAKIVGAPPNRR